MTRVTPRMVTISAAAVFALWGASWALSYVDLGTWSFVMALAIATAKAGLVVVFFMELLHEGAVVRATLATALAMVLVLTFFMVEDVRTRDAPARLAPEASMLAR